MRQFARFLSLKPGLRVDDRQTGSYGEGLAKPPDNFRFTDKPLGTRPFLPVKGHTLGSGELFPTLDAGSEQFFRIRLLG